MSSDWSIVRVVSSRVDDGIAGMLIAARPGIQ